MGCACVRSSALPLFRLWATNVRTIINSHTKLWQCGNSNQQQQQMKKCRKTESARIKFGDPWPFIWVFIHVKYIFVIRWECGQSRQRKKEFRITHTCNIFTIFCSDILTSAEQFAKAQTSAHLHAHLVFMRNLLFRFNWYINLCIKFNKLQKLCSCAMKRARASSFSAWN